MDDNFIRYYDNTNNNNYYLTSSLLVSGPCKNLQFFPIISSKGYPVSSTNAVEAYIMGFPSVKGLDMQKLLCVLESFSAINASVLSDLHARD